MYKKIQPRFPSDHSLDPVAAIVFAKGPLEKIMGCRLSQNAYFRRCVAKSMCLLNINGVSTHHLWEILTNSQVLLNIASLSGLSSKYFVNMD